MQEGGYRYETACPETQRKTRKGRACPTTIPAASLPSPRSRRARNQPQLVADGRQGGEGGAGESQPEVARNEGSRGVEGPRRCRRGPRVPHRRSMRAGMLPIDSCVSLRSSRNEPGPACAGSSSSSAAGRAAAAPPRWSCQRPASSPSASVSPPSSSRSTASQASLSSWPPPPRVVKAIISPRGRRPGGWREGRRLRATRPRPGSRGQQLALLPHRDSGSFWLQGRPAAPPTHPRPGPACAAAKNALGASALPKPASVNAKPTAARRGHCPRTSLAAPAKRTRCSIHRPDAQPGHLSASGGDVDSACGRAAAPTQARASSSPG